MNQKNSALTKDQERAADRLRQQLDELSREYRKLSSGRKLLQGLGLLALLDPVIALVMGGRRYYVLRSEIGEIGIVIGGIGFAVIAIWLAVDVWRKSALANEIRQKEETLSVLGLRYIGTFGFGADVSYLLHRGSNERWRPHYPVEDAVPLQPAVAMNGDPNAADHRQSVRISTESADVAMWALEHLAEARKILVRLGGVRSAARWVASVVLPVVIYWSMQDPQYYQIKRLFGDMLFGILPMVWIGCVIWLYMDEKESSRGKRLRDRSLSRLREQGLRPVAGDILSGFGLVQISTDQQVTAKDIAEARTDRGREQGSSVDMERATAGCEAN